MRTLVAASSRNLLNLPFWLGLVSVCVAVSWFWNLRTLNQQAMSIALERGRYTFKIIESTRLWVARHGVAYVRRSEKTPSNPYLEIDEKDITTPSGIPLTAVNPAYMTRQLTGILKRNHQLTVHLTSLKHSCVILRQLSTMQQKEKHIDVLILLG